MQELHERDELGAAFDASAEREPGPWTDENGVMHSGYTIPSDSEGSATTEGPPPTLRPSEPRVFTEVEDDASASWVVDAATMPSGPGSVAWDTTSALCAHPHCHPDEKQGDDAVVTADAGDADDVVFQLNVTVVKKTLGELPPALSCCCRTSSLTTPSYMQCLDPNPRRFAMPWLYYESWAQ